MTTKHTPGPWKAHPTGLARSGLPEYEIHWSDIGECIAERVHGEAEAHLIAAAPELLKALREVAQTLAWHQHGECRGFSDYLFSTADALSMARAAIAKATGETP